MPMDKERTKKLIVRRASKKTDYNNWPKEQLVTEVIQLRRRKKYGLVWDGERKPESIVEQCKVKLPVLKEIKNKSIGGGKNDSANILIEGDNYHALSVLNYTHKGKIDVIYIDPPYNTGAKDWKYNNHFVDINDSYRHSKWLSFMEKRLRLARGLLKKNGVLICTIDKNEQANLGVLLNELFFDREIVCLTIIHNPGGIQGKNFSHTNEFAYFIHPLQGTYISAKTRDDVPLTAFRDWGKESSKRKAAKTCFYPILVENEKIIGFGEVCNDSFHPKSSNVVKTNNVIEVYPIDESGVERKWRFGRDTVIDIQEELFCKKIKNTISIFREKRDFRWKTVWTDSKYNANVYGTKLLNNIIAAKFPYPKSLFAVMDCVRAVIHDKNNATILDFFAGSGTTGHAVLELNKDDNGKRKFILCTNNEDNNGDGRKIADEICYPRIKKVMKGYKGLLDGKTSEGLGGNLKYFRTAFVGAEPNDKNKEALTKQATEMLCLCEDTLEQIKDTVAVKIFRNSKQHTGIVFDEDAISVLKREISKIGGAWSVYVFSLGDDTFEEEFEGLKQKITVAPVPEAILRVYRRLFKP
jgi:adenine-specific DNA-methyltransferase